MDADFGFYRFVLAPVFGTICFVIGAPLIFLVSAGRWRVRRWPRFFADERGRLEPSTERVGDITYVCADTAVFTGLGVVLLGLLVLALCSL
jgi:hypothetical protein